MAWGYFECDDCYIGPAFDWDSRFQRHVCQKIWEHYMRCPRQSNYDFMEKLKMFRSMYGTDDAAADAFVQEKMARFILGETL